MKQKTLSLLMMLFVATLNVSAYDFEVDGIYYGYDTSTMTAYVTYKTTDYNSYSGSIVIPATVTYNGKTLSVASVGRYAFRDCTDLKSVTISDGVPVIADNAFASCTNLKSVTIPNSVTTIGSQAFSECSSLTTITLPDSLTTISSSLFSDCLELAYINIPDSVTTIGSSAFSGCSNLENIAIPFGVTEIGSYAFYGCSKLTNINIPSSVTIIDSGAFRGCVQFTSIIIPKGVITIGSGAFEDCPNLTSIYIPKNVTSIKSDAFNDTTDLHKLVLEDSIALSSAYFWDKKFVRNIDTLYLGNSKNDYYNKNFMLMRPRILIADQGRLNEIVQDSLEVIYSKETDPIYIYDFDAATYIDVPLYVPTGTKSLYESINGWKQFFNIIEMDMSEMTAENVWKGTMPKNAPTTERVITDYDFEVNGIYYLYDISTMTAHVTYKTKEYNTYSGDIVIPSSVTYHGRTMDVTAIGEHAFSECTGLTSVTLPNSVTTIEKSAFYKSTSMTSVNIPSSVTEIGEEAFLGCSSLTSVIIPDGITTIEKNTFGACSSLVSVSIPNSVETIGESAFDGCHNLSSVTIPNSVKTINNRAFMGCESLISIFIPNSVKTIGRYAFSYCPSIKSIYISKSVKKVGESLYEKYGSIYKYFYYTAFGDTVALHKLILEDNTNRASSYFWDKDIYRHIDTLYIGGLYLYNGATIYVNTEPETLIFGEYLDTDDIEMASIKQNNMKVIYSKITSPKVIDEFDASTYANVPLYVPTGTKSLYESVDGWKQFFNIIEMDMSEMTQENIWNGNITTNIRTIEINDIGVKEVARYNLDGVRLLLPQKGINILKMSDGTIKKIIVK